ncbi:hypothetical protein Efla_004026 [Eimeria flavescens]
MSGRRVVFECRCGSTVPGQWLTVVGSSGELGSWCVERGVRMTTSASAFPLWSSNEVWLADQADSAHAAAVEFKFVVGGPAPGAVVWEQLPANRRLSRGPEALCYRATFGSDRFEEIPLPSRSTAAAAPRAQQQLEATWMGRSRDSFSSSLKRLSSGVDLSPPAAATGDPADLNGGGNCAHLLHSFASSGGAASGAFKAIVEGDAGAPSWGAKLEVVKNVVRAAGDGSSLARATPEQLVAAVDALCYAGVYTELVRQGAVSCKEDGRHFRPNRHANISREVSIHLEMLLQAVGSRDDDLAAAFRLVIRAIPPALPSFADAFRAAQPLTRIRNIAHRDDIPMELKNEIKHTIQNKLHRCAGPEDLETTRKLLERVNANREQFSAGFVSELGVFYGELCAFFNQADLCQRLQELRNAESPRAAEAIDRYLDAKARSDGPAASPTKLLLTLGLATDLRLVLALQLREAGQLQEADMQHVQNKRMAELQLEDAAFVLLSRLVNAFESSEANFRWTDAIEALYLGVRNMEASGIRREECRAIQRELQNHARGDLEEDEALLLLKATVDRTRRSCQDVTDLLLAVYLHRVEQLGSVLKVDPQFCSVYAEGRIRSNVIFQLAKVSNLLLKGLRERLHQAPFDILVAGSFVGKVVVADTLERALLPLVQAAQKGKNKETQQYEPLLLCAKAATGDEEVAGADAEGRCAAGVVVGHDLPILSHLGVRARQQRLPFIACQDPSAFAYFASRAGRWLEVEADAEGCRCRELEETEAAAAVQEQKKARRMKKHIGDEDEEYPVGRSGSRVLGPLLSAKRYPQSASDPPTLLRGPAITLETCGAKASTCARLEAAAEANALNGHRQQVFRTPRCLCLPFGSMEWVLHAEGRGEEFASLLDALDKADPEETDIEPLCSRMQQLILSLPLPPTVQQEAAAFFGSKARLCLRSSANVEDLAGLSAAGLYESVANVPVAEAAAMQSAACTVWASLFSRRAVLARKVAAISQRDACMAVLMQELLVPELSFVLHTGGLDYSSSSSSSSRKREAGKGGKEEEEEQAPEVYAELAPGLGEILASARMRGSAYRMLVDRETGKKQKKCYSFCFKCN